MKLNNNHVFFNGLCSGCDAAVKQEEVDPDKIYSQLLCGRCCAELEQLPPRYRVVFNRLKSEMEKVAGNEKFLNGKISVLEGFIIAHGLNPQCAEDKYNLTAAGRERGEGE